VETFTGDVLIEALFQSPGPAPFAGASVTFEPGARSAWHTHPFARLSETGKLRDRY
jgi:quercetin dioxygenase-like cupin family protein